MNKIVKILIVVVFLYSCWLTSQSKEINGEILNYFNYTSIQTDKLDSNNTKVILGYQQGNICTANAQCYNQIIDLICNKPICIFSLKPIPFVLAMPF